MNQVYSQEHHGLILSTSSQSSESATSEILCFSSSTAFLSTIWAFCCRCVRVKGDQGLGRETGSGQSDMEAVRIVSMAISLDVTDSMNLMHTDWRDGLSNGYLTGDVREARGVRTGHGLERSQWYCPP